MSCIKKIALLGFILLLSSCADYKKNSKINKKERPYYSSTGFALMYEESLFKQGVVTGQERFQTWHGGHNWEGNGQNIGRNEEQTLHND